MQKLKDLPALYSDSFFVGALYPFAEEGTLYLLTVQHLDKYKSGKVNTKLPGGSVDEELARDSKYFSKLEEVLEKLGYERRAVLMIMNQEYSRKELYNEHPEGDGILWLLHTLVIRCLEATGYYPADIDPYVVDIVERTDDHYQYFLEMKEWWDKSGDPIKIPVEEEDFKTLDPDIVAPREKTPILEFEELLIGSHKRPVEFYLEHLKDRARQARMNNAQDEVE